MRDNVRLSRRNVKFMEKEIPVELGQIQSLIVEYLDPNTQNKDSLQITLPPTNYVADTKSDSQELESTSNNDGSIEFTVSNIFGEYEITCNVNLKEVSFISAIENEDTGISQALKKEEEELYSTKEYRDIKYSLRSVTTSLKIKSLIEDIKRGKIIFPYFQRDFVWKKNRASLLIDSILKELFIPPIIFFDTDDRKLECIDGQQRIISIFLFAHGVYPRTIKHFKNTQYMIEKVKELCIPEESDLSKEKLDEKNKLFQKFSLINSEVSSEFEKKTSKDIFNDDSIKDVFMEYNIPSVEIFQRSPLNNMGSYEIFYRINTGSTPLNRQEVRVALTRTERTPLADIIDSLADKQEWISIIGAKNNRKGSQEMLLRSISLLHTYNQTKDTVSYKAPMSSFLDKCWQKNLYLGSNNIPRYKDDNDIPIFKDIYEVKKQFINICELLEQVCENDENNNKIYPWAENTSFNLVIFDLLFIGLLYHMINGKEFKINHIEKVKDTIDSADFKECFEIDIKDTRYSSHTKNVENRVKASIKLYSDVM